MNSVVFMMQVFVSYYNSSNNNNSNNINSK